MTSKERHERRYQRRKAEREAKANHAQKSFDEVFNYENLWDAAKHCCRGSGWKSSVINFRAHALKTVCDAYEEVMSGKHDFRGFTSFKTIEHGKERDINAIPIKERVIQKCLCSEFLTDVLSRTFIYDNGACLKNKGYLFQLQRMKKHLRDHYKKYGLEGGIYQFDFKSYFASIPHDRLKERLREYIEDDRIYELVCYLVDDFQLLKTTPPRECKTRGIGLGSEISQVLGLLYASPIDHYIKDQCGIHGYGRYNDDGYVISNDLQELKRISHEVERLADSLGITINKKKNKITPFSHHGFTFLKTRFRLMPEGKVIMKLAHSAVKRERVILKKFKKRLDAGLMQFEDVLNSYQSWRGYVRSRMAHDTLYSMDALFLTLYEEELRTWDKRIVCSHRAYHDSDGWHYVGLLKKG